MTFGNKEKSLREKECDVFKQATYPTDKEILRQQKLQIEEKLLNLTKLSEK
jgi:hypothetical protein